MEKNLVYRLREFLLYIFKEVPILLLLEVWTIIRVFTIVLVVSFLILGRIWETDLDVYVLSFFK